MVAMAVEKAAAVKVVEKAAVEMVAAEMAVGVIMMPEAAICETGGLTSAWLKVVTLMVDSPTPTT